MEFFQIQKKIIIFTWKYIHTYYIDKKEVSCTYVKALRNVIAELKQKE